MRGLACQGREEAAVAQVFVPREPISALRCPSATPCQGPRQRRGDLHTRWPAPKSSLMTKPTQRKEAPPRERVRMTTAEATVAALVAHGIDTIYALPGVHNDSLFDALFRAGDHIRTIHTRHEQGAAYMALGAALGDRETAGICRRARSRPAQFSGRVAHCLWNERASARADRADSAIGHRPWARASARNSRPARHHRPAGRFLRADPRAKRSRGLSSPRPSRLCGAAAPAPRCWNARWTCGVAALRQPR